MQDGALSQHLKIQLCLAGRADAHRLLARSTMLEKWPADPLDMNPMEKSMEFFPECQVEHLL
jgi:hypothetical protein